MPRHIVCITFDFDAMSPWIARGMMSPTPISRGEFGIVGARRVVALMSRFNIKTSWFIPGHTLETYLDACRQVADAGHEIGHHGWTHVPPANMTREEEEEGLIRANEQIKKLTGRFARGYRSPSWDLSAHSVELLIKHGFYYESSMMGDDYTPYRVRQGDVIELLKPAVFGRTTRLIEMPISWSLDDYPHFEYVRMGTAIAPGLMNANDVLGNWIDDFLYMKRELDWGIITYTCHPFVIGRGHRMLMLERLIERLGSEGAEFMPMEEAAGLFAARAPFSNSS